MKKSILTISIINYILFLASCTPTRPYEITSPCVAIESTDPYAISPCVRRPANSVDMIL